VSMQDAKQDYDNVLSSGVLVQDARVQLFGWL
jgi:hypothetical protein